MLSNPYYAGDSRHNHQGRDSFAEKKQWAEPEENWIIVENTHEPIVPRVLYLKAQERLKEVHKKSPNYGKKNEGALSCRNFYKKKAVFTHEKKNVPAGRKVQTLLFCAYCGRRLTLSSWGNKYRCGQAAVTGITECGTIHVDKEGLENAILSCTRTMAGMVSAEVARKKKEWSQTSSIEAQIKILEAEKNGFLYENSGFMRITVPVA